jgi:hypothetical protein
MLVNIATQRHQPWHIEDLRRNRFFLRPITAQVETLGGRVGKNIVVGVLLEIRKFHLCAYPHRQERGNKGQLFLHDLFGGQGAGL